MVLAGGVQRNLLHQHQFVVLFVECGVQHGVRIGVEPGEHLLVGAGDPGGGVLQAVPVGILADRDQQLAHRRLGARLVEHRGGKRRGLFCCRVIEASVGYQPWAGGFGRSDS